MKTSLLVLCAALLVAACGTSAAAVGQPTPRIVYVTPAPTETPDSGDFLAYLTYNQNYMETSVTESNAMTDALDVFDADTALSHARRLLTLHEQTITYLESHPPAPCYADHHAGILSAVRHFASAMRLSIRWLGDFPYGSEADLDAFAAENSTGVSELENVTDNIKPSC